MSVVISIGEAGGTTVLDDGTRVHWADNRRPQSWVAIEHPDGAKEACPVAATPDAEANWLRPYRKAARVLAGLAEADARGHAECRAATPAEVRAWAAARKKFNL